MSELVREHVFFIADSLTLTFRPFCRSSLRRAGLVAFGRLVVDTSGEFSCGNERIIGVAVQSVRAVESLYVTVLGSAAYIGALVDCVCNFVTLFIRHFVSNITANKLKF